MAQRVDSRALRRYVVRLHAVDDGTTLGTGFFVAPGKVLTCAHVVRSAEEVDIVPADNLKAPLSRATVCARSELGELGQAPWPFPDLAVLDVSDLDHPCPPLYAGDPDGSEDCHAYGFLPNQEEMAQGSGRTFKFESVDGAGYLLLKQGQSAPGLSGAPLLCPVNRAIVGVVVATRNAETDLGGWASPISALLRGEFRIGDDLAEQGHIIDAQNLPAAVAERSRWQQVLPVAQSTDGVEQVWAEFKRKRKSNPSDLLVADYGVVPYLFRDTDLDDCQAWCELPEPIAIRVVPARGGGGKSRFAIEVCKRMLKSGWIAGFWSEGSDIAKTAAPRLVVVDYAEHTAVEGLRDLVNRLGKSAKPMTPVRLLALSRHGDPLDNLRREASASIKQIIDDADDTEVASSVLQGDERVSLYAESFKSFSRAWDKVDVEDVAVPDLSGPRYDTPLDVLFEAFSRFFGGKANADVATASPVDQVLDHEQRHWKRSAPWRVEESEAQLAVALATLAGASDRQEAEALMEVVHGDANTIGARRKRKATAKWLAGLYQGDGYLTPLRPDRLGEALVSRVIRDDEDAADLLVKVMTIASDTQLQRSLEVLARVVTIDGRLRHIVAAAVLAHLDSLVARARTQAKGTMTQPGSSLLTIAIARLMTGAMADDLVTKTVKRTSVTSSDPQLARSAVPDDL